MPPPDFHCEILSMMSLETALILFIASWYCSDSGGCVSRACHSLVRPVLYRFLVSSLSMGSLSRCSGRIMSIGWPCAGAWPVGCWLMVTW